MSAREDARAVLGRLASATTVVGQLAQLQLGLEAGAALLEEAGVDEQLLVLVFDSLGEGLTRLLELAIRESLLPAGLA